MKTSKKLYEQVKWMKLSATLAYELIDQDKVDDAACLLKECEKRAVKRGNYCLNDMGALEIMKILFLKCQPSQAANVDRLFMEYFPRMHPAWYSHKTLWMTRLAMYKRMGWDTTSLIRQIEARLLKGRFGQKAKNNFLKTSCSQKLQI